MAERPILFSAPMVRALLAGTKTQTRRAVKWRELDRGINLAFTGLSVERSGSNFVLASSGRTSLEYRSVPQPCPYGLPGDRLWVREAFIHEPADYHWLASVSIPSRPASTAYRADFPESNPGEGWKPSIHMPRNLSRITLDVVGVRIERLWQISDDDVRAEGCEGTKLSYAKLWESINGEGSWDANPFVWVVEFRRIPCADRAADQSETAKGSK